jgi:hypothetical protein
LVLRKDPIRPNDPPYIVYVVQSETKEFLPLDNRLFELLAESDIQRRFNGRDQRFFGHLLAQDLEAREKQDEINREKPIDEKLKSLEDGLAWLIKKEPSKVWRGEVERMTV